MSDDLLGHWLEQAGRFPLLTPAEELHLGRAVREWLDHPEPVPAAVLRRGRRARERMIAANLRLVVAVARRFSANRKLGSLTMVDLLQEGALGLARGVEKFDPCRGYKFSTYAYWWIRQSVQRTLASDGRMIRVPQHIGEGSTKNPELVAAALATATVVSLDAPAGGDDDATPLRELLAADPDQDCAFQREQDQAVRDLLGACLDQLPDRERAVLEFRAQGITYKDCGAVMGCSRSLPGFLGQEAMKRLRAVPELAEAARELLAA